MACRSGTVSSGWRPCASAAARAWPWSSSGSPDTAMTEGCAHAHDRDPRGGDAYGGLAARRRRHRLFAELTRERGHAERGERVSAAGEARVPSMRQDDVDRAHLLSDLTVDEGWAGVGRLRGRALEQQRVPGAAGDERAHRFEVG